MAINRKGRPTEEQILADLLNRRDLETGRRKNTRVSKSERKTILQLYRSGQYTIAEVAEVVDRSLPVVKRIIADEQSISREATSDHMLDCLKRAAVIAAENGDGRLAIEVLDRLGVLPETTATKAKIEAARVRASQPKKKALPPANHVNVGIVLPGVNPTAGALSAPSQADALSAAEDVVDAEVSDDS